MDPIKSLDNLVQHVIRQQRVTRIAVAAGEDPNTLGALAQAVQEGFVKGILLGRAEKIQQVCQEHCINPEIFQIIDCPDEGIATSRAVEMVRCHEADALMKGLVGTDKFLKAVLNKETGLLPPKAIMSYVCALEIPKYHKLLFLSDTAVLPFPDLHQKIAMINYAVAMAHKFGIVKPKVSLLSAAEKVNETFPATIDYGTLCKMADREQIKGCEIDGPLDLFLACDPASIEIKGVATPMMGDSDILIFPSLEAANIFYKGLMLFAGGELAGLIQGTIKPVIVMSRSESAKSKYYCIALACLMAEEK